MNEREAIERAGFEWDDERLVWRLSSDADAVVLIPPATDDDCYQLVVYRDGYSVFNGELFVDVKPRPKPAG